MNAPRRFRDRRAAGQSLALLLQQQPLSGPCIVLALPRGGLPVAVPVAKALGAPLDVLVVRKIGLSSNPECAIGAVAPGIVYHDASVLPWTGLDAADLQTLAARAEQARREREHRFHAHHAAPDLSGRTAIVVDDGIATGATMIAALRAARAAGASQVIAAAPVASHEAMARLAAEADECRVVSVPPVFNAVGEWYEDFPQVSDAEALALLDEARS